MPIGGQIPGNGNQSRILPSNTRGIARYLVIPVFEVPDGQRQPRGHTTHHSGGRARRRRRSDFLLCQFIAIAHGPRRRVTKVVFQATTLLVRRNREGTVPIPTHWSARPVGFVSVLCQEAQCRFRWHHPAAVRDATFLLEFFFTHDSRYAPWLRPHRA